MENNTTGVIYFRLNKDVHGYEGDITKNCGLTGLEIDSNFHFLRGYDIESGKWDQEKSLLVLNRVDGTTISISGISSGGGSAIVTASGSTYDPETGILQLNINNEITEISGFTECCKNLLELIEELSGETNERFEILESGIVEYFEIYSSALTQERNERIATDNNLENEIISLDERVSNLECEVSSLHNTDELIERRITNVENGLNAKILEETENRKEQILTLKNSLEDDIREEKETRTANENELENEISYLSSEIRHNSEKILNLDTKTDSIGNDVVRKTSQLNDAIELEAILRDNADDAIRQETEGKIAQEKNERLNKESETEEKISNLNSSILEDKHKISQLQLSDEALRNDINNKTSQLGEKINTERQNRIAEDEANRQDLDIAVNAEKSARIEGDRLITQLLQIEVNNRVASESTINQKIDEEKIALQRSIINEKNQRLNEDNVIYDVIYSLMLNSTAEYNELKNYLEEYYTFDNCNAVKMKDVIDESGNMKRLVYLAVAENDKILSQGCGYLTSTLKIRFNGNNKRIELLGINDAVIDGFDASVFIQRGFLKNADVVTIGGETYLAMYWEGVAQPTLIPATALFEPYTGDKGILVDNTGRTISVKIRNGERFLGVSTDGLYTTSALTKIEEDVQSALFSITQQAESISFLQDNVESALTLGNSNANQIQSLIENISGINEDIESVKSDIRENRDDITTLSGVISNINIELSEINNNIDEIREDLNDVDENFTNVNAKINNLSGNVDDIHNEVNNISEEVDELKYAADVSGQTIDSMQNDIRNLNAMLGNLDEIPEVTQPTIKVNISSGSYEVGSTVALNKNIQTTVGNYEFGIYPTMAPGTGVITISTGFTDQITQIIIEDNTNYRAEGFYQYTDGQSPATKLGNEYVEGKIIASTITGYSNYITGFRYRFFRSGANILTSLNSTIVRNQDVFTRSKNNNFNISIKGGDKQVLIVIPSGLTLKKVIDTNLFDTDITTNFTLSYYVSVYGAEEKSLMTYNVYEYMPDTPFVKDNVYKIEIE